jgi:hypothetical protein
MQAETVIRCDGGYFMSEEQEAAANWQMFQTYKNLTGRLATLDNQVQQWATAMRNFGGTVSNHPGAIESTNLMGLPDLKDLEAAKTEMASLSQQITTLKGNLQKVGMELK